jgi:beta-galactosidase
MPSNPMAGNIKPLNGTWKFKYYPDSNIGSDSAFYNPTFDVSRWANIKVPGHWELQGFADPKYTKSAIDGTGLYRTDFMLPAGWKGNLVYLTFDGVLFGYKVWVNGQFVGEFSSAFNRHIFDITSLIKPDQSNILAVEVSRLAKGWAFDIFDCWSLAGIFRDVTLFSLSKIHINDVIVKTYVDSEQATVSVKAVIEKAIKTSFSKNNVVYVRLLDHNGNLVGEESLSKCGLTNEKSNTLSFSGTISVNKPMLWTAETPYMYTMEVSLLDKGNECQKHILHVGIREISWHNGILKINGLPIKLRGVNHHDLSPTNGRAVTEEEMCEDLRLMRKANINFIRTSHYPPQPRLLELCDSLGFYVMDEVPFGGGEEHMNDPAYLPNLLTRAQATVERDKNHPCIIVWSIGNENPFTPITHQTGKQVKRLDETRPICYPQTGSYFEKDFRYHLPDSVDILSPHYPTNKMLKDWTTRFDRPMIITEYAHSFGLDFGRMEEQWEMIYISPNIAGGAVWHFFDQGLLRKSAEKVNRDKYTNYVWKDSVTNYDTGEKREGVDGIVYADRTPQVDYWQVRKVYSPVVALGDTIVYSEAKPNVNFKLNNRYDFTDLSEVDGRWQLYADTTLLDSGSFKVNCLPHDTVLVGLDISLPENKRAHYCYLKLVFTDKDNYSFYEKVYSIITRQATPNLLEEMARQSSPLLAKANSMACDYFWWKADEKSGRIQLKTRNGITLISDGPYARVNRKPTMASMKMIPYVLKSQQGKITNTHDGGRKVYYFFEDYNPSISGYVEYQFSDKGYITVNYHFSPDSLQKTYTLETGISFLLPFSFSEFRWIGDGPYASYPGKSKLNDFGFYHLSADDIYFQGNRKNVDCAVFSDKRGNGFILLANKANLAVEKIPEGILVSHNAYVSGRFNKGNAPELLHSFENIKEIVGSFVIIPLTDQWPIALEQLFGKPYKTAVPFSPFYHSYDQ